MGQAALHRSGVNSHFVPNSEGRFSTVSADGFHSGQCPCLSVQSKRFGSRNPEDFACLTTGFERLPADAGRTVRAGDVGVAAVCTVWSLTAAGVASAMCILWKQPFPFPQAVQVLAWNCAGFGTGGIISGRGCHVGTL